MGQRRGGAGGREGLAVDEDANEAGLFSLVGGWSCLPCLVVRCLSPDAKRVTVYM